MYIGHKVTLRGQKDYTTGERTSDRDGTVLDVNRDQYGTLQSLYVMVIEEDDRGYVYMTPLQEVIFHNGKKLLGEIDNPYQQMMTQTLSMMLQGATPMEV